MQKHFITFLAVGLIIGFTGLASADTILVDRGLPSINLNDAAGPNRSNVTWSGATPNLFTGDTFSIGTVGQSYVINSLTVWGAQYNPLSIDLDNISLYMGTYAPGSSLALVSTGAVTDNTNSNPNISHTFVNYPKTSTDIYVGNGGGIYGIAQTTFSNLNYLINGGVTYDFGVYGDKYQWWSHASNAALSGTPQDGSDGQYLEFDIKNLSSVNVYDSNGNGWDKSSDINVKITGSAVVPEPSTILLFGIGTLGLVVYGKRRVNRDGRNV